MCDVRKSVVRLFVMGLAAGLLAGTVAPVNAQKKPQQRRARRETNASRQVRIQRTIEETYAHRYEVFGGGGFERFRPGEFIKKDNQITWAVNTTYYLNPKLGVIASAQGAFGHAESTSDPKFPNENVIAPKAQINEYYFMAGPSYRFYAKEKLALSAQAQGGVGWGIFGGGSKGLPPTDLGIWPDSTRAAFSFGVSMDYNFYPNLAFRFTPQYIGTTFGGQVQNNVGFNAGVIYRFGHK